MKFQHLFILTLIFVLKINNVFAQKLTIVCNSAIDTVKACIGQNLRFECNDVDNRSLKFNFDDGTITNLQTETYAEHKYLKSGMYIVDVTAFDNDENISETAKIVVEIGIAPFFSNYKNTIPDNQTSICMGESTTLSMQLNNRKEFYNPTDYVEEKVPQPIYNSVWTGNISFKNYDGLTISSPDDIDFISVYLEFDNTSNLNLNVKCPDGKSLILKDYGGKDYQFGLPADVGAGTSYNYFFKQSGTTINNVDLQDTSITIPSGDYKSETDFSTLNGCPINGQWQVIVSASGTDSDGYVNGCKIKLKDEIIEANKLSYTQMFNTSYAVWSGNGVGGTSNGSAKVTPQEYGQNRYNFVVSDNFSCLHDTFVLIEVEKPQISWDNNSENYIGDEIEFNCDASWCSEYNWNFGDKSPFATSNPAPHAYYDKGVYQIIVQATSKNGCVDRDTQSITIIPRPLEIKEVNIFSPTNDGINDVFSFFKEDESYLKSGGLTLMPANVETFRGKIYNVFGQTICKWNNVEEAITGWDGTLNNNGHSDCPPGTYFYDIIVTGKDGSTLKRSGTIFLYKPKK